MANGEGQEAEKKVTSVRRDDGKWSVVTSAPKVGREATVVIDLHDNDTASMIAWTSEKCVKDAAISTWIIGLQSNIRRMLQGGKTQEEIQTWVDSFKPDVVNRVPVDPVAATLSKFANMDAEAQAAFMKELKARLSKKA